MLLPRFLLAAAAVAVAPVCVADPAPPAAQVPMVPPPPGPGPGPGPGPESSPASPLAVPAADAAVSPVPLADVLAANRALTSFASLARLHASTEAPLAAPDARTIVLAPLNSAIERLPRKPWEDPRELAALGAQAYDGSGGEARAAANLRRFVEAHLVVLDPASPVPWREGEKASTMAGRQVWWAARGPDRRVILPDDVEVERVASKVANGEIWILKHVLQGA